MTETTNIGAERAGAYLLRQGESRGAPGEASGFKIRAADSGGLVSFFEFALDGWQSGPDLHLHSASDESFYVLEGALEMQVGDERHVLEAGEFAWVPRDTPHTFANAGADPARALTIATPGGIERFFAEHTRYLEQLTGPPGRSILAEIRRRHGGQLLGPPIRARNAPAGG